jgi:ribose transport system substrate-binding protein
MRTSLLIIFISLFLITAALVVVSTTLNSFDTDTQGVSPPEIRDYRFHFILIAQGLEESYWKQISNGMNALLHQEKIGLEFYGPNISDPQELRRILEMGILAGTDGILLAAPYNPSLQPLLAEAAARKIPLVMLANLPEAAPRFSFVGISAYDLGYQTGQALQQAVTEPTTAALLVNFTFSATSNKQYLDGFQKAIRSSPRIRIGLIVNSKGESISAEEQTQNIIKKHPEIRAIICSNPSDTLGVAKLVVDRNQVSRITIIGAGLTSEIVNYIRRQVIWGVLADDPVVLGAQALSTLLRQVNAPAETETYRMPLYLITAHNVDFYRQKFAINRSDWPKPNKTSR